MEQATEENVVVPPQSEKILRAYRVPLTKVADMINEANKQITQSEKGFLGKRSAAYRKMRDAGSSADRTFFAARRHRFKNQVYVIRINYHYVKAKDAKQELSPVISGVEVINEKNCRPILPL
jgi:ribosomal protein L20